MELYINTDALPEGYNVEFFAGGGWDHLHHDNRGFKLTTPAGVKRFEIAPEKRSDAYDLMYEERQLAVFAITREVLKAVPADEKVSTFLWIHPSSALVWSAFSSHPDLRQCETARELRKVLKAKLAEYAEKTPKEKAPKEVSIRIRKKDLKKATFADPHGHFFCSVLGSPESDKSFSIRTKDGEVCYIAREDLNRSLFGLPFEQRFLVLAALLKQKLDKLPEGTLVRSVEIYNFSDNLEEDHIDGVQLFLPSPGLYANNPRTVDTWCAVLDGVLHMYTRPDTKEVAVELTNADLRRVEFNYFGYADPFDTFDVHSSTDIGFTVTFLDGTKKKFIPKAQHTRSIYNERFEDRPYAVAVLAADKAKRLTRTGQVTIDREAAVGESRRAIFDTANQNLLPLTINEIDKMVADKFKVKTVE